MQEQLRLTDENVADHLRALGLLPPDTRTTVEPAGDGNINWVRRVREPDSGRSWIVKQARPALERFPQYQVTTERIVFEARYYETVRPLDRERVCPEVERFDPDARVLVLEDLGAATRMDHALAAGADCADAAEVLGRFLGAVHAGTREPALAAAFANDAMRRLHGDHIFDLPFRENDFVLPEALVPRARAIQQDRELRAIASDAYARYLAPRGVLVHADVQAGNVLLSARGPKLLDAEIAHVGDPAFDVGVLVAHLLLPAVARGEAAKAAPVVRAAWRAYARAHGPEGRPEFRDAACYAGIEMTRRTVGAARAPAVAEPEAAFRVLDLALRWIRTPPAGPQG